MSRYMRGFDLVLTYNWGGFDAVMARRLFGGPPLVHHEDGFNEDETERLNPKRNLYRRIGLKARFAGGAVGAAGEDRARELGPQRRCASPTACLSRDSPGRRRPISPASSASPAR